MYRAHDAAPALDLAAARSFAALASRRQGGVYFGGHRLGESREEGAHAALGSMRAREECGHDDHAAVRPGQYAYVVERGRHPIDRVGGPAVVGQEYIGRNSRPQPVGDGLRIQKAEQASCGGGGQQLTAPELAQKKRGGRGSGSVPRVAQIGLITCAQAPVPLCRSLAPSDAAELKFVCNRLLIAIDAHVKNAMRSQERGHGLRATHELEQNIRRRVVAVAHRRREQLACMAWAPPLYYVVYDASYTTHNAGTTHMHESAREITTAFWLAYGAVWLLTAFRLKPVVRRSNSSSRMWELLILVCAAELLFGTAPKIALLDARYLPADPRLTGGGMALTAAGVAFCIVARLYLGQNWSATATIKQDHQLIRTGPYKLVRHPIYTGTLIAAIGTAMAFGEIRDLLALPLAVVGFSLKARSEERLLMSNFGDRYAAYRREVRGAIIPYVL